MKRGLFLSVVASGICLCAAAYGLDRDAEFIESATANYTSYDKLHMDVGRLILRSETVVLGAESWAVVVGASGGQMSPELGAGRTSRHLVWSGTVGVKNYVASHHSLSLLGGYEWVESGKEWRIGGGTLAWEFRPLSAEAWRAPPMRSRGSSFTWSEFSPVSAEEPISPFLGVDASLQNARVTSWLAPSDTFRALVLRATAGCDFRLGKDFVFVFQGQLTDSSAWSRHCAYDDYADGWSLSLGMKYFWR